MNNTRGFSIQPGQHRDRDAAASLRPFCISGVAPPLCAVTTFFQKNVAAEKREGGLNGGRAQRLHPSQAFWMHATRAAQNMACLRHRHTLCTTSSGRSDAAPTRESENTRPPQADEDFRFPA